MGVFFAVRQIEGHRAWLVQLFRRRSLRVTFCPSDKK